MQIITLREAEEDIAQAMFFYEGQSKGLGQYFLDSISADIESLVVFAGVHIQIYGYYRLLAKRFPFAIYYKYESDKVNIYAVLDCRSNPKKHYHRLQ